MTEPTDLAESVSRTDRIALLQWNIDGVALVETQATLDQLGAVVIQYIGLHPDVLARVSRTLSGSGAPAADLGIDGDSYVDLVAGLTYSKAAGAWSLQGSLGMNPKGAYNAATNSPALSNGGGGGIKGDVYWVSTAGTVAADGIGAVLANDQIVHIGTGWVKRPKTDVTYSADQGSTTDHAVEILRLGDNTITNGDARWGPVTDVVVDGNGLPLSYRIRATGQLIEAQARVGILSGTTATYETGTFGTVAAGTVQGDVVGVESGTLSNDPRWGMFGLVMIDGNGRPIYQVTPGGVHLFGSGRFNHLRLGSEPTDPDHVATKAYVDENAGGGGAAYTAQELLAIDAQCAAASMAVMAQGNPALEWIGTGKIGCPDVGQSFALGFGATLITWPVAIGGVESYGSRPANAVDTDTFSAVGADVFTTRLNAGNENPIIATGDHLRWRQLQHLMLEEDATRGIVISAMGKGGQPIEAFLPGATPVELYGQCTDWIDQTVAYAATVPVRYRIPMWFWTQGPGNYGTEGVDNTRAGYLEKWQTWKAAIRDYVLAAIPGHKEPGFFLSQTSSRWDTEAGDVCAIGLAQIDAMLADPAVFVTTPEYPYPKDGTHPNGNGYRMLGDQRAKVAWRVMGLRQGWRPCMAMRATFRGSRIVVRVHTPVPPLQVRQAYDQDDLVSYTNHGIVIYDDNGARAIESVTVNSSSLVIDLSDGPLVAADNPRFGYAKYGTDGAGNLCDSDRTPSFHENTLTGAAHELVNWMCATDLAIEEDVS